ncbi:hypothetical protein [Clostridium tertium]|uniref:Uncharacterized protein n=1 Tax=Clostridium tertium TaxID=1559 RepID=A0A6N3FNQ2_9CLOT
MDFVYRIIPVMISMTIAQILLFKVWKNPLRIIGNTVKKKLISFVIIFISVILIEWFIDSSTINYKEVYSSLLLGIFIMVNGRLFCTDIEGEDKYKSKNN